jgi:hypothetical protein
MIDSFTDHKEWVVALTGVSKDALHIHTSLLLIFVTVLVRKRPLGSFVPWTVVLAFESLNEILDYVSDPLAPCWQEAALHDLVNTMFWPTALVIVARLCRTEPR